MEEKTKKIWTPEEIAEDLNISAETVRRWLRDNDLRGLRLGRQWRIEDADYQEFKESRFNK